MLALSRTKSPLFRPSLFHEKAIVHVGGEPFGSRYALQHDVASQPDVVLSSTTSTTEALLQQTRSIPIIFGTVADPVGSGLVASLPRPGGHTTGFTNIEGSIAGKWLELLKQIARASTVSPCCSIRQPHPTPKFILALSGPRRLLSPWRRFATSVGDTSELESAVGGFMVIPDPFMSNRSAQITSLTARHRLPAIFPFRFYAKLGGLLSYGSDQ
jgi:ABC transporter substrate binding protein